MARLYLPHVGGVEKHIEKLSEKLQKKYDITLICFKHDKKLPNIETINNVTVYRIPSVNKWFVWYWLSKHFYLLVKADLIHIHDVFYWYLPFKFLLSDKKVFTTFHGYEGSGPPNFRQKFWHKVAAKFSDGYICVGGFHEKWYGIKCKHLSYGAV